MVVDEVVVVSRAIVVDGTSRGSDSVVVVTTNIMSSEIDASDADDVDAQPANSGKDTADKIKVVGIRCIRAIHFNITGGVKSLSGILFVADGEIKRRKLNR